MWQEDSKDDLPEEIERSVAGNDANRDICHIIREKGWRLDGKWEGPGTVT